MGSGEYRDFRFPDFSTMSILHFVVPSHKHPTILMTEADDLWVFHVAPDLAVLVSKPFGESLNGKSSGP